MVEVLSRDDDQRLRMGDVPVREIQETIASLDAHRTSGRLSREQKVSLAYANAIARVLEEQSALYVDLYQYLESAGASYPLLREQALDQARIIAELWLSARAEHVDISAHLPEAMNPLGGLLALEAIKGCDIVLAADEPEEVLLLFPEQIDLLVHNPFMDAWWARVLPRDEDPPPHFGSGTEIPIPSPTTAELARAQVILLADCVESSALDYHALVNGDTTGADEDIVREGALQRAIEINRMTHGNVVLNIDFGVLDETLDPAPAGLVLKAIGDSCIVFAAPKGDFERYGLTARAFQEMLDEPALRTWLDAVEKL
jgi:hypothetical protein